MKAHGVISESRATQAELERLIYHMPAVASRATSNFAEGFALSITKQARRRNWRPSTKQLNIMRDLVASLFASGGNVGGDFDVIE